MKTRLLFVPLPIFVSGPKKGPPPLFPGGDTYFKTPFLPSLPYIPAVATRVFLTMSHSGGYRKKEKGKLKVRAKKNRPLHFGKKTDTF